MIRRILPSLTLLFLVLGANAQFNYNAANASITANSYVSVTAGQGTAITTNFTGAVMTYDDDNSATQSIGFTFNFAGQAFTQFVLNSNGFIRLGNDTTKITNSYDVLSATTTDASNVLYPFNYDLDAGTSTPEYRVYTTGTVGSRICTIQFKNVRDWNSGGASAAQYANLEFQIKLYEGTNIIEYRYKKPSISAAASAVLGINAGLKGADGSYSVNATKLSSALYTAAVFIDGPYTGNKFNSRNSVLPTSGYTLKFTPVPLPANDAALKFYSGPTFATCLSSSDLKSVSYTIRNTGTSAIASGAATVNISILGPNATTKTITNSKVLAGNDVDTITVGNLNLSNPGRDTITAIVTLAGDTSHGNDTVRYTRSTATTLTTLPQNDGGDLSAFNWIDFQYGASNGWRLGTIPYTNSAFGDSLRPYSGSSFYYFNSVASAALAKSTLYTQCITLPSGLPAANYYCTFWMSHDSSRPNSSGFGSDSLFVTVSNDKGATWTRLKGFDRIRAGFDVPTYAKDSVNLAAYSGQTIHLGLEGVGNYGNAFGIDDITINANFPLPISLTAFTGTREGTKNVLNWYTANETKNKGFELQRSINGKEFSAITFVNSKSTNGAGANYTYTDEKPLSGTNYYRLRQIDNDGKASFSNIVVLKSAQIRADISRVYPNPVQDKLNIVLNTVGTEKVTISITDLVGKTIAVKSIDAVNGDNNISFNTSKLANGTYLIKVISSSNSELATQKFVKQ